MRIPIDKPIARTLYYHPVQNNHVHCPECGTHMEPAPGPFLLAVRPEGKSYGYRELIISGDFAYHCPDCPTAVADAGSAMLKMHMQQAAQELQMGRQSIEYVIGGWINLDAVPEEEHETPLNELKKLPLVEYNPPGWPSAHKKVKSSYTTGRRKKKRKK